MLYIMIALFCPPKKRGKGAQVTNFLSNKRIIIKKYFNVTFLSDNFRRNAFLFAIDITMLLHYYVRIGLAPFPSRHICP